MANNNLPKSDRTYVGFSHASNSIGNLSCLNSKFS